MTSARNLDSGRVSNSAGDAGANPLKSKEPMVESYADKRFKQIVSSIRNLHCIGEQSGFLLLASIKRIKESSSDPDMAMDNLHNVFSAVECDTDSRARFYVNFYLALLENRNMDQRWISLDFFVNLKDTLKFIETHASGDALFDSRDVLISMASNPKFQPNLLGISSEISYHSDGYGAYLGLRVLESLVLNPHFKYSWIGQGIPMAIGNFAYDMNEYRLGERKFDHFDNACRILSDVIIDFDEGIFGALLNQHSL
jgi:hypothetical protein